MDINKAIVTAALKQLGDSFTVGQLVDKILEEAENEARRVFYHHKL